MSKSVLVLYASTHGHTAKIGAALAEHDVSASIRDVRRCAAVQGVQRFAETFAGSLQTGAVRATTV